MTNRRGLARTLQAALGAAAALLGAAVVTAPRVTAQQPAGVAITVVAITPSTPEPTQTLRPLRVQLHLTNTTETPLPKVVVTLRRGDPLFDQNALDASLQERTVPTTGLPIPPRNPKHPPTVSLAAGGSADVTFTTLTGIPFDAPLCLCAKDEQGRYGVYPLYFSANAGSKRVGASTTYLPSFYNRPKPVQVNWVWPLLDRPHRLVDSTVFTDDALATSVATGGRLDRALRVIEDLGSDIPLTVVLDPELVDELEVMRTGHYTVQATPAANPKPGTGQQAAAAWLDRLRNALQGDPNLSLELTPFADPDIDALHRDGLTWTSAIPAAMSGNLLAALDGRTRSADLVWPVSGTLKAGTLDVLAQAGVSSVILDGSTVTPRVDAAGVATGTARLRTRHGTVTAALTSPAIEQDAGAAIGTGGSSALPALVATIAMRAAQEPDVTHPLVITAPRYVDASPPEAELAIRATSRSPFSQPTGLQQLLADPGNPPVAGRLAHAAVDGDASGLATTNLDAARSVTTDLPTVDSLLAPTAVVRRLLGGLSLAVQRIESAAWRVDPAAGEQLAKRLAAQVHALLTGVHIVHPQSGTFRYTLASGGSPLPITVENTLPYPVQVRVRVATVNKLPGFTAKPTKPNTVDPQSKLPLRVSTKMERRGQIQVEAQLTTVDGRPLGDPVGLTVHSTFLGAIGVVITVVAGAVLLLALLFRLWRRFRGRRRPAAAPVTRRRAVALAGESVADTAAGPAAGTPP